MRTLHLGFSVRSFFIFAVAILGLIGCSGNKNKPNYNPTAEQQAAIQQLQAQAAAFRDQLLANPADQSIYNDFGQILMNGVMNFMTADGGQSANYPGAMQWFIYMAAQFLAASNPGFSALPVPVQLMIAQNLARTLQNYGSGLPPAIAGAAYGATQSFAGGDYSIPTVSGGASGGAAIPTTAGTVLGDQVVTLDYDDAATNSNNNDNNNNNDFSAPVQ